MPAIIVEYSCTMLFLCYAPPYIPWCGIRDMLHMQQIRPSDGTWSIFRSCTRLSTYAGTVVSSKATISESSCVPQSCLIEKSCGDAIDRSEESPFGVALRMETTWLCIRPVILSCMIDMSLQQTLKPCIKQGGAFVPICVSACPTKSYRATRAVCVEAVNSSSLQQAAVKARTCPFETLLVLHVSASLAA